MGKYKTLKNSPNVLRDDNAVIPFDPRNKDYQEFQKWVAAGNTPDPPDADPVADPDSPDDTRKIIRAIRRINNWIKNQDPNFNPVNPNG